MFNNCSTAQKLSEIEEPNEEQVLAPLARIEDVKEMAVIEPHTEKEANHFSFKRQ